MPDLRGVHDVGGAGEGAPIPREQHAFAPWEVRVDAMMSLLSDAGRPGGRLMTVDELRRGIESLSPAEYRGLGYYERWLRSLLAVMSEKGVVEPTEVERRAEALAREHEAEHAAAGASAEPTA